MSHDFEEYGNYEVTLTLSPGSENSAQVTRTIYVGPRPVYVSGSIENSRAWPASYGPYVIDNQLTVDTSATLTVEPGAVVKFALETDAAESMSMDVNGMLSAEGTEQDSVVFTSIRDDAYGGDTNGDGDSTTATAGDWDSITVFGSGDGTLDHTIVRYGGRQNVYGDDFPEPMVRVSNGFLSVTNSVIGNSYAEGLKAEGGAAPLINGNRFAGNEGTGLVLENAGGAVRSNAIESNNIGVSISRSSTPTLGTPSEYGLNVIQNNSTYDVENTSSDTIQAVGNYWGTTSASAIDNNIYDDDEDSGSGPVVFNPFLNVPPEDGNVPPVASPDSFQAFEDSTLAVGAPGVLGNDSDPDGDSLTASLLSGVSNGSLTLNGDGSFEYTPASGFVGTTGFTYEVVDGAGASDTAAVTLTVGSSPPSVPTSLTASPSNDGINLEWTGSASEAIAKHRIYRSAVPIDSSAGPGDYSPYDSTTAGDTSYLDAEAALSDTTYYYYRVTAVDTATAAGGFSAQAEATLETPIAAHSEVIDADGSVDFGATGVDLVFDGVQASGEITVRKFGSRPEEASGIAESHVSPYRFVVQSGEAIRVDSTEVQFEVGTLAGITDAATVTVYTRSVPGAGSFAPLATSYASDPDELWVKVGAFSEFVLASNDSDNPLPVQLTSFDATTTSTNVRLRWRTASERGNSGFDVQRTSSEADGWETIGVVESKVDGGTTTEAVRYHFTDTDVPYAADSLAYRLRQVDADGTANYSEPTVVQRAVTDVELRGLYPNPARTQATVRYSVPSPMEVTISLYDVLGRRVRVIAQGQKEGRHNQRVDVADLSSGTYFLRLKVGKQVQHERLTVVK